VFLIADPNGVFVQGLKNNLVFSVSFLAFSHDYLLPL
jgi:hypothetical protein